MRILCNHFCEHETYHLQLERIKSVSFLILCRTVEKMLLKNVVLFFSIIVISHSYIVDYGPVVKATKGYLIINSN